MTNLFFCWNTFLSEMKWKKSSGFITHYIDFKTLNCIFKFFVVFLTIHVFKRFSRRKRKSSALPIRTAPKQTVSWEILLRETQRYKLCLKFHTFITPLILLYFKWEMFPLFFVAPDNFLHHPEHFEYNSWHHGGQLWATAPNVSTAPRAALCYSLHALHFIGVCFISFRTSAQNIAPVKVTAKVVIELPLSVTG